MKISKIKKTGKKYKILFDNDEVITTYDDVIINNSLLFDKNIDNDLLNKINNDTSYYDIYYKTVNYITKKLRSEKEINEFIDKNNVSTKEKKLVIEKLKSLNLINDLNFTKAFISDRINLSNDGPHKIKKDLLQHNINESIIDEEIRKIDNELLENKINKLVMKKVKNSKYRGYVLKQKILNDLINLGYDKTDIINTYENIDIDSSDLLKKEYEKIYKKLRVKYEGIELENKIKSKLYQKGFKIDDINNILYYYR